MTERLVWLRIGRIVKIKNLVGGHFSPRALFRAHAAGFKAIGKIGGSVTQHLARIFRNQCQVL